MDIQELMDLTAEQWADSRVYRFYFLFEKNRYHLMIAEAQGFDNGVVVTAAKGKTIYKGQSFITVDEAFDSNKLTYFYNKFITAELDAYEADDDKEPSNRVKADLDTLAQLSFKPTTTMVISEQDYKKLRAIAKQVKVTAKRKLDKRQEVRKQLATLGFWQHITGRVIGGKEHRVQKVAEYFIFEAVQSGKVLSLRTVEKEIKALPNGPVKAEYLKGIELATKGKTEKFVVLDWNKVKKMNTNNTISILEELAREAKQHRQLSQSIAANIMRHPMFPANVTISFRKNGALHIYNIRQNGQSIVELSAMSVSNLLTKIDEHIATIKVKA